MDTAESLIKSKGHEIWSVHPNASVYDALVMMADKKVGALLVMENDELVGIISERDYARKIILKGKASKDTFVHEIMTANVICVNIHTPANDCMAIMTEKRIRHLPVFDGEQLIGVISIGDVVKGIISEQEFVIDQLEKYIVGR